jgi:mRNA interferase RelE/StbE
MYSLIITKSAEKQLDNLDDSLVLRIDSAIIKLAANPRPSGCKKLKGYRDIWRIRIGTYRVVYQVDESQKQVIVLGVLHRKEAYR